MSDPTKPVYTPALGSKAAVGMAHIRAAHPEPVNASDLAELLECDAKNVSNNLGRCLQYGLISVEKVGNRNLYRLTEREALNNREPSEITEQQLKAFAKRCVVMLRGVTKSSVDLASWCETTATEIDRALAPLVDAGHLIRVDVLRGGKSMFDYRWGATYVPHDADFEGPVAAGVPVPSVQPVADKVVEKPRKAPGTPTNPASPWRKEGYLKRPGSPDLKPRAIMGHPGPELHPVDALAIGAELGKKEADERGVADLVQDLHSIGFTTSSRLHDDTIKVPDFKQQDAQAMLGWQVEKVSPGRQPEPKAGDEEFWPEFSINNRGFMVITNGVGVVELEAKEALALKRFLDNTSILEELDAGGAL